MKQHKPRTNWLTGAALFGGFLLSLWLDLTGLALHQWLGLAVGALAAYHLAAHWRWVAAVTSRFFGRAGRQARAYYIIDAGLAAGFAAILVTGLAISTWLGLAPESYAVWHQAHIAASIATLALVVIKIGFHWRWIASVARRSIFPGPVPAAGGPHLAPVVARVDRRDFVRLMAGVGTVALLAGVNALAGSAGGNDTAEAVQSAGGTTVQASTASAGTATACTVRCRKRCSYPGHCRKYTDSNGNGRCDLGECLS